MKILDILLEHSDKFMRDKKNEQFDPIKFLFEKSIEKENEKLFKLILTLNKVEIGNINFSSFWSRSKKWLQYILQSKHQKSFVTGTYGHNEASALQKIIAVDYDEKTELMLDLAKENININYQDKNKNSALHCATKISNSVRRDGTVTLLLDNGIDKNLTNSMSLTAVDLCTNTRDGRKMETAHLIENYQSAAKER